MCTKQILTDGVLLNTVCSIYCIEMVLNTVCNKSAPFSPNLVFTLIAHWTGRPPSPSTQGRDVPAPGDPLQTNKVVPLVCLIHQRKSGIEETK